MEIAEFEKMLEDFGDAWMAYVLCVGEHYATADGFSDSYMGEYDSPADWAADFLEETGALLNIPDNLRYYFDYDAFAKDCSYDGYSFESLGGSVYVFSD